MNNDFPRIITFLRKERGLSQKQAASELGISQALLSHYEKGIRECGLDFLIRAADYYDVTTDYLLGRTLQRSNTPSAEQEQQTEPARANRQQAADKRAEQLFDVRALRSVPADLQRGAVQLSDAVFN